ncbi:MAG: BtrH N-terminal domain-containing protein [Saprospiraceae bacterium]|nr:BtrH N-terminal domain-containing protein [Saprospiraceae bacterium]
MNFNHIQSAHCETGVIVNMLDFHNMQLSEPMIFGIGSGIFFIHLPFIEVNGVPATNYRIWPGGIFSRATKLLGAKVKSKKFRSPEKSMETLDDLLAWNIPVGVMCSVYYLPYLPDAYRFHFNAHNIIIWGKEGDEYIVGDPVLPDLKRINKDDLQKARWAKGFPEPSGKLYYIEKMPSHNPDLPEAIRRGIRRTMFLINSAPLPFIGVKGINYLAGKIEKYPEKYSERKSLLALGNLIRMQEEIGTGGGGFRFMYAAFLKEAGKLLNNDQLNNMSSEMTEIGDQWRVFAYNVARIIKDRAGKTDNFQTIANQLREIGEKEVNFFKKLGKIKF